MIRHRQRALPANKRSFVGYEALSANKRSFVGYEGISHALPIKAMRDKNLQCAARQAIVFFIGRSEQFSMRTAATARFTIMIQYHDVV